jgi:sugar phosphate isomerase/epimerase
VAPPSVLFSTAAFFARPLAETFRLVAEAGYAGVEVMVTRDPASRDPVEMARLAAEHDLEIGAIHAPCLLVTRRIWGTDPLEKIARAIEVARAVGARVVVMHPPYRWQQTYRRWLTDELPHVAARTGVVVAIENMFPVRVAGRAVTMHAAHDLEALERLPHVALDTSHAAVAGHDLVEIGRRLAGRLAHVHLSDNLGRGWDNHLPPGDGVLPLEAFCAELALGGYDGRVSLEVDLRGHLDDPGRLRGVMVAMRERVEASLAPQPGP